MVLGMKASWISGFIYHCLRLRGGSECSTIIGVFMGFV